MNSSYRYHEDGDAIMVDESMCEMIFETTVILSRLSFLLSEPRTCFVVGCVAWLTHSSILRALQRMPCTILCNAPQHNSVRQAYSACTPYLPGHPAIVIVPIVKCHRHNYNILLHHKFLVGLDCHHRPIWTLNGSFNITNHACCNYENAMVITHPDEQVPFLTEFHRILSQITRDKPQPPVALMNDRHTSKLNEKKNPPPLVSKERNKALVFSNTPQIPRSAPWRI